MRRSLIVFIFILIMIVFISTGILAVARQNDLPQWLYFSGSLGLYRMYPDGSHIDTLVDDLTISGPVTWSPDNQWLIFTGSSIESPPALYRFNVYTLQLEQLATSGGTTRFRSWSPNGEWLHYIEDYGAGLNYYYIMHPDGSDNHSPYPEVSYSFFAGWSPDSQWMIFDTDYEIYRVRPSGEDLQKLTVDFGPHFRSTLTPDREWIVYHSQQYGDNDIFRMRLDGSENENLTNTPERYEDIHTLSPNGKWLIYTAEGEYWRMRLDGSEKIPLDEFDFSTKVGQWSPDGEWLYVEQGDDFESELLRIHIATGEIEPLTENGVSDIFQLLSSDGNLMIYTSGRSDGVGELWIMNLETKQSTLLIEFPHWIEIADFSPDGEWLYLMMPDESITLQMFRVRLDGTDLEQLTDSEGEKTFLTWSQSLD